MPVRGRRLCPFVFDSMLKLFFCQTQPFWSGRKIDESARLGAASNPDPQMIYPDSIYGCPTACEQEHGKFSLQESRCKLLSGQALTYICRQQTEPLHKNVRPRVTYTDTEPKKIVAKGREPKDLRDFFSKKRSQQLHKVYSCIKAIGYQDCRVPAFWILSFKIV